MRRVGLLWQFFPPLLSILVVSLVLVTGFSGRAIRSFMVDHTTANLGTFARVLVPEINQNLASEDTHTVQEICNRVGLESGYRLTVILGDGTVVGDSDEDPFLMENHATREEVLAALHGQQGRSQRYSSTLGHQRLYVAVPGSHTVDNPVSFVVRTSVSLESLGQIMTHLYKEIALVALALVILAGLIGFLLARKLSNSLKLLQHGAEAYASGNLHDRIRVDDSLEINAVATSMNRMADQLADRIHTVENQRNELEAVLASMNEGILAIDQSDKIIRLNHRAAEMLASTCAYALGRSIQEIGHHPELTRITQEAFHSDLILEKEIKQGGRDGILLQVRASGLVDLSGHRIGTLVIMSNMTELRRLETMRRDFVANVSHELKTPVTSIMGFTETLLQDPPEDPAETRHFLEIINRQTHRLENIIGDLLALSHLEQSDRTDSLEKITLPIGSILERIVREIGTRNPETAKRLTIQCPEELKAKINAPLLEQAIGNLIDNALIYSPEDSTVRVVCSLDKGIISLSVIDAGPGIPAEHLPRLFERFYRVDKARSRRMGGTGLGLAIVKHITQIHGGRATVASTPGEGSTFTLTLPMEA